MNKFFAGFIVLLLVLPCRVFGSPVHKKGVHGALDKEAIMLKLSNGNPLEGYVLKGDDLIDIIQETDFEIRIRNAVIEGGLDFTRLPGDDLEQVQLPGDWDEKKKELFINIRSSYLNMLTVVKNKLVISHSEIGTDDKGFSVNGEFVLFAESLSFEETVFEGHVNFLGAAMNRDINCSGALFGTKADFLGAEFFSKAGFSRAVFQGEAVFMGADFREKADFFRSEFARFAYFEGAHFRKTLDVSLSKFKEYADFRNTSVRLFNFNNDASPTVLEGRVDFRRAKISEAHFQDIVFEKNADFSEAQFGILLDEGEKAEDFKSVFKFITFESDVYFFKTRFSGYTKIQVVNFNKTANFRDAEFIVRENIGRQFSFSYLNFDHLMITWKQFPDLKYWQNEPETEEKPEPLSEVLKGIEANFRKQNQLDDANKACYYRKETELKEAEDRGVYWALEWFWGISCGYGTDIWRILGWSALFDFIFTLIYCAGNLNKETQPPAAGPDFEFKQRLFDLPGVFLSTANFPRKDIKFFDALRFSTVILFKVGTRRITVSGKFMGIRYGYIVWFEWILGFVLLAAIVETLSNTLPMINRLISGIF
jgi:uncharacterized protein YjbI with pentapeptide repeats